MSLSIQVRAHYTNKVVEIEFVRSTETLYILKDAQGFEVRFRKLDGWNTGATSKRNVCYSITLDGMSKLPG